MDNNIREEVLFWNAQFPVDKWWRDKHKIPFMSKLHRDCSFIYQLFEYEEERILTEFFVKEENKYEPNIGEYLKVDESNIDSMSKFAMDELNMINGSK